MIGTVIAILNTLKDGFKFYKENKKNLFERYLDPAIKDFEVVHSNYLSTFTNYYEQLSNNEIPIDEMHPILDNIKRDSLFSDELRNKVYSYYDYSNNKLFADFNLSVLRYFQYSVNSIKQSNLEYEEVMGRNVHRRLFYFALVDIMTSSNMENKRELALEQVTNVVKILQRNHREVFDSYNSLKNELLK